MPRQAKQSRPQLVCILADNSGSMAGEKAKAATLGIQEMLMECQSRAQGRPNCSYYKLLLIRFGDLANVDSQCDMAPVCQIDPNQINIAGDGGQTNITDALQVTLERLRPYMQGLEQHSEHTEHPLPLVLVFSDGAHNKGPGPQSVADEIKKLSLDGEPVVIAAAGVALGNDQPDEKTLRAIASSECYVPITNAQVLSQFISSVGSSGMSRAKDVANVIKQVQQ